MVFYEITLLSVPEIIFAYSVEIAKYKNKFPVIPNFLEIALCEQGHMVFEHSDGRKELVCPGMLAPIFKDMVCNTYSYNNEKQKHTTVGIKAEYTLQRHNSDSFDFASLEKRMRSKCTILIPYHLPMEENYADIMNILKMICALFPEQSPHSRIKAISQWFFLTSVLTELVLKKLGDSNTQLPPSEYVYAEKAEQFINENYVYNPTVESIAAHLNISCGYLHRIFRDIKGMGITEYINTKKVSAAINLMENKNMSLREAAANVGITDPAYMSRLFKKVTGLACREYFRNKSIY
ncbi:MAG: helix-turn-helix transcriptional regulator [Clostridia bacterium]|nr:helix-turn-helix transcriptional regulator [Clostridia bacterium]